MLFHRLPNTSVTSLILLMAATLAVSFSGCNEAATPENSGTESTSRDEVASAGESSDEAVTPVSDTPRPTSSEPATTDDGTSNKTNDATASTTQGDADAADRQEVQPGEDPLVAQDIQRKTTEGWWRIIFSVDSSREQYPQDYSAGFIKVGRTDDGKYEIQEVRTNDIVDPAKPTQQSNATEKEIRLYFEYEDNKFDYAGTLEDNVIRGNLQFSNPRQNLVRLIPVKESEVTDEALEEQNLGPTFGGSELLGALQSGTDAESVVSAVRDAAKTWRTSPVLFTAYDVLIQNAGNLKLDRSTVEELATEFEQVGAIWGERAKQAAKLNTAVGLMFTRYQIDLARQKLEEVRKDAPELVKAWSQLLEPAEQVAAVEEAWQQVQSGNADEGLSALRRLHREHPADSLATYRLAAAEQSHGSKEDAMRLFSKLAVQPQGEGGLGRLAQEGDYVPPRVAAGKLYEESEGSREGFDEFLLDVYRDTIVSFLSDEDRNRQPTEGDRTVLVELFTGATCPPCVSADVATAAVEESFPPSDVVVLRYHVHSPGPDPLANPETQARYDYYASDILGTPTVFVDGETPAYQVGGGYDRSPEVYQQLAATVAEVSAKEPAAKVELSAAVEGDALRISASASGAEKPEDSLRLRIAIAENDLAYTAMNGILNHSMIVRDMPGGADGIKAVDGAFRFEETISLPDLRDRLDAYLDRFEEDASRSYGRTFAFGAKPLDFRHWTVVAFLQDDTTHEVLQTAVVPIEQEIELPPLADNSEEPEQDAGPSLAAPTGADAEN